MDICIDLASHWRGLVKEISDSLEVDSDLDLRKIGEIARPAADVTLHAFEAIQKAIESGKSNGVGVKDECDIQLSIVECKNIIRWLKQWPSYDASVRQKAIAAYNSPECEFAAPDDLD